MCQKGSTYLNNSSVRWAMIDQYLRANISFFSLKQVDPGSQNCVCLVWQRRTELLCCVRKTCCCGNECDDVFAKIISHFVCKESLNRSLQFGPKSVPHSRPFHSWLFMCKWVLLSQRFLCVTFWNGLRGQLTLSHRLSDEETEAQTEHDLREVSLERGC